MIIATKKLVLNIFFYHLGLKRALFHLFPSDLLVQVLNLYKKKISKSYSYWTASGAAMRAIFHRLLASCSCSVTCTNDYYVRY